MLPSTVDPIELIYTIVALVGLLAACDNLLYAAQEWRINRRTPPADPRKRRRERIVAWQVLCNRAGMCGIQGCVVVVGLRAMILPPNQAAALDWTAAIAGVAILLLSLLASLITLTTYISNHQFDHIEGGRP